MTTNTPTNQGYAAEAPALLKRYEARASDQIHSGWTHLFPPAPCDVIDIGAGTGRDAGWLAAKGCTVLAVEPTTELREPAKTLHPNPNITWLDDALPALTATRALGQSFDLTLITAVWMHLDEAQRAEAMPNVAALMRPGARLFITSRHGPIPEGRRMFDVTADETIALASAEGLTCLHNEHTTSVQPENAAKGVTWTKLAFDKPPASGAST